MSDSARHALYLVAETAFGVLPDEPDWFSLRHTGTTLAGQRSPIQSAELRADRQITDFRLGSKMVAGDITGELSYGAYDLLLEAAFGGTWARTANVAGTVYNAVAVSDGIGSSANDFITAGFAVGQKVRIAGFATSANNGDRLIASVAAGLITVTALDGGDVAMVNEAAGAVVSIQTWEQILDAGTERRSFSFMRQFTDIEATGDGKPYHVFLGCEINSVTFTFAANAIATVSFAAMGREAVDPSNDVPEDSSFVDAPAFAPMDSFTGVFNEGGAACGVATELTVTLENGMEPKNVIGSAFGMRPSIGRSNATGQATAFFEDAAFLAKFNGEDESSLELELPDLDGNRYWLEIPRVRYTGGQADTAGQGAITIPLPFQALRDATKATNIRLRRMPATFA